MACHWRGYYHPWLRDSVRIAGCNPPMRACTGCSRPHTCWRTLMLLGTLVISTLPLLQMFHADKKPAVHTAARQINQPQLTPHTTPYLDRSFVLPSSEWLKDVDVGSGDPSCGRNKCVFGSRTSQQHQQQRPLSGGLPDRYGYLVAQQAEHGRGITFEEAHRGWQKAQQLSHKFSIRHLLAAEPRRLNCTKEQAARLNGSHNRSNSSNSASVQLPILFHETMPLIVQPIRLVPEASLLFGCYPNKHKLAMKQLAKFVPRNEGPAAVAITATKLSEFEERLRSDFDLTTRMLKSSEGSCMGWDFQVFIDPTSGRFYHFDFDRCFEKCRMFCLRRVASCPRKLQEYTDKVLQRRLRRAEEER